MSEDARTLIPPGGVVDLAQLQCWYRTLDHLLLNTSKVEVALYERLRMLFEFQADLVLYDRTLKDAGVPLSAQAALEALKTVRHVRFRVNGKDHSGVTPGSARARQVLKALKLTNQTSWLGSKSNSRASD